MKKHTFPKYDQNAIDEIRDFIRTKLGAENPFILVWPSEEGTGLAFQNLSKPFCAAVLMRAAMLIAANDPDTYEVMREEKMSEASDVH